MTIAKPTLTTKKELRTPTGEISYDALLKEPDYIANELPEGVTIRINSDGAKVLEPANIQTNP